jgi:hypothetical protein
MRASILAPQRHDRDVFTPCDRADYGDDAASPHLVDYRHERQKEQGGNTTIKEQGGLTMDHFKYIRI